MDDNGYNSGVYEVSSPGFGERFARKLRTLGHWLTAIPFVGRLLDGLLAPILTGSAALIESVGSLANGEYTKAGKQLVSGAVDTAVTAVLAKADWVLWLPNLLWATASGSTLGEQARQLTNWGLDSIDTVARKVPKETEYARSMRVLGDAPMTRGTAIGAVGWSPGAARAMEANAGFVSYNGQPQMPRNYFTDRVAASRGQTPEEARALWLRDEGNQRHFQDLVRASREQEVGIQSGRA